MQRIALVFISCLLQQSALAYIDTTSKAFPKPKTIKPHPYTYKESKVDKYIDITADKVGGSFLGNVIGGPVGFAMKLGSKAMKHKD